MKPKALPSDALHLFQAHFRQLLNLDHPLIQLAAVGSNLRKRLRRFFSTTAKSA